MIKDLEENLKAHHIKPTAMRLLVLEYLLDREIAVSLTDLYKDFVKSERTTIYRTLKAFEDNGLMHRIDDGTCVPKYALCEEGCRCEIERDLHLHFHCRKCGETKCLYSYKIPEIILPPNHQAEEANLMVKGVCFQCSG
ncbi:Fur family transcriptional regulator [Algoriphagus sp.]|uniref:Fur family transcriptional regulator n=1 Tax=Algoriphagus sp. TaxID=1872435 RepID=UPI003F6E9080